MFDSPYVCVRRRVGPLDERPLGQLARSEGARHVSTAVSQELTKRVWRDIILYHSVRPLIRCCLGFVSYLQTTVQPGLPPFLLLRLITEREGGGHLTGAGKDTLLLGYLMVNDLFNVEVAETTVVWRKLLRWLVLRRETDGGKVEVGGWEVKRNARCHNVLTSAP